MLGLRQITKPTQLNKTEGSETKRFVLVHGGGFGAWCWYKTITLLEKHDFQVDAVDLTGSGVSSIDTTNITSLAHYSKPLLHFFESLKPTEKVILVGHDFGGACMSYAMEMFPSKISKAIFISAAMLANGQSTLDLFNQQGDRMGRRVSAGGGQSSLGYLFGSGEAPKPVSNNAPTPPAETLPVVNADPSPKPVAAQPDNVTKQITAGINNSSTNNYIRADGQNTGNFLTDRPSTKVHAAPGGGSSLDYLFGGGASN